MYPVTAGVKGGEADRSVDGRSARWSSHRAARREEFVDAALRAVARHGPDVSIAQVAAEAGVSKPVLYRQFTDKADLLVAVQERGTALLLDRLVPAINAHLATVARIRGAIDAFFSVLDDYPNLYWLAARSVPVGPAAESNGVQAGKALAAAALSHVFDENLRAFGLDAAGAEPWAHAIVGMVQNTAEWWLREAPMSRPDVVDHLTTIVWAAVDGFLRHHGITIDPDAPLDPGRILSPAARTRTADRPPTD